MSKILIDPVFQHEEIVYEVDDTALRGIDFNTLNGNQWLSNEVCSLSDKFVFTKLKITFLYFTTLEDLNLIYLNF